MLLLLLLHLRHGGRNLTIGIDNAMRSVTITLTRSMNGDGDR